MLAKEGSRVYVVTVPECLDATRNSRTTWINGVFRDYVADHDETVRLADLANRICIDEKLIKTQEGSNVYDDKGLTTDGARLIWKWFGELARKSAEK